PDRQPSGPDWQGSRNRKADQREDARHPAPGKISQRSHSRINDAQREKRNRTLARHSRKFAQRSLLDGQRFAFSVDGGILRRMLGSKGLVRFLRGPKIEREIPPRILQVTV